MKFAELQKRYAAGTLTAADLAGVKPKDSIELRKDAGLHRFPLGSVLRDDSGKKVARRHRYVMSSEEPCGPLKDVVLANAWDLADYKKRGNPLLWAHDGSQPWLGKVENPHKVSETKTLEGFPTFMEEGLNPFADLVARMVDAGYMTNGSVGFRIEDARTATDAESKQRKLSKHSMIITKARLAEFSIVPVGADPNAVKKRSEEVRNAIDGLVERGETDRAVADHLLELFGFFEPLASRSIIVPEFTWRSEAEGESPQVEPESVDDEPAAESEAEGEDAHGEDPLVELKATIEQQAALIASQGELIDTQREASEAQAATIEALTERLEQAEEALAGLGDTTTRLERMESGLSTIRKGFGIEEKLAAECRLPLYAGLFEPGIESDLTE